MLWVFFWVMWLLVVYWVIGLLGYWVIGVFGYLGIWVFGFLGGLVVWCLPLGGVFRCVLD